MPGDVVPMIAKKSLARAVTADAYANFPMGVGVGTNNATTAGGYLPQYQNTTRNRMQLDMMYRGSWIIGKAVDSIAEDMTREGFTLKSDLDPDDQQAFHEEWDNLDLWTGVADTIKWGRLYGGAVGFLMIDGQDPATPLRVESIGKGQFRGILPLDRWSLFPYLQDLVPDYGPDYGLPTRYRVQGQLGGLPTMIVHYTRVFRFLGRSLPYYQRIAEQLWGMSVAEPIIDRLLAFDSATQGAAQLIFKAYLRRMKVKGYRNIIATGGALYTALMTQINTMRAVESLEGVTVFDAEDTIETTTYSFAGLSEVITQFGQQLSGAMDVPMVRLFGQSPTGMNATGESDFRTYYDGIKQQQNQRLKRPINLLCRILSRSVFGRDLPKGFTIKFNPLWDMSAKDKGEIAKNRTEIVIAARSEGLVSDRTALKEFQAIAEETGVWTTIGDEEIEAADDEIPQPVLPTANAGETGEDGLPAATLPDTANKLPSERSSADTDRSKPKPAATPAPKEA